jgi:hypothetical protein
MNTDDQPIYMIREESYCFAEVLEQGTLGSEGFGVFIVNTLVAVEESLVGKVTDARDADNTVSGEKTNFP